MNDLRLYNTHTRRLEAFTPLDAENVRVYFCGPTVYDRIHLGNLRSMLCADLLIRLLRALHPKVTYVRNITDIDDKIISRARENCETIDQLTARTTQAFHEDLAALSILPPDVEPRATDHIPQMQDMIAELIKNGHAYVAEGEGTGHVLFDVRSFDSYGALSGRTLDDMQAGARVEVATYKRDPGDFVLWKPSAPDEPGWDSPWGRGRPGWHIECSAMAGHYLGESFDIHGGGNDLLFPHHENERAQSLCCHLQSQFARHWLHVGMLLSNGEKMSKSLGNFHTVREALDRAPGEALRLLFLSTHYRSTLDFTWEKLDEAKRTLDRFYRVLEKTPPDTQQTQTILPALLEDLNTPQALGELHALTNRAVHGDQHAATELYNAGRLLGLFNVTREEWFKAGTTLSSARIEQQINERLEARKTKDFARADAIRNTLAAQGIILEDGPQGTTWRKK